MKKIYVILIIILAVGVCVFWYLGRRTPQTGYKTVQVEQGTVIASVSATGTVNAVTTVEVGSQVSGTIQKLFVDYNSDVKKGQVIAEIDPALFLAQVEQARGNALNAQGNLQKAKVTLADAKRTLERNRLLLEQGVVSQSDFDASETAYEAALAGIKIAEAGITQTSGALRQAETNLKNSVIHSPVDGIVISRSVDVGQTVAASFQTPTLFTIAQDLTKMQIETSVDEADIGKVRLGQIATFTVDAYPEKDFQGNVTQIRSAPVVTQNVVTYVVVITVDNRDLLLMPGMTANVFIETGRSEEALKVVAAALRFKPQLAGASQSGKAGQQSRAPEKNGSAKAAISGEVVYLLKEGKPLAVPIKTGLGDGRFVEITEGNLQAGDELIVEQTDAGKKKSSMGGGGRMPMGPRM
ncbi:MAG: efflux RND transporter periplasmic adaptor subunit [Trichlorobacter sp.]|nr:efflux RND transporter periplasmic adaptor subunit [Trichlorobacter sp.]